MIDFFFLAFFGLATLAIELLGGVNRWWFISMAFASAIWICSHFNFLPGALLVLPMAGALIYGGTRPSRARTER